MGYKVYNKIYSIKYDISERCYAVYDLLITNNGSNPIYFKLNGLRLHEGDRIFNATTLEPYQGYSGSSLEVLHELENKNELQDTVLLPGQSLNGIVAFRVNSLYNRSFLLKYKTITVDSASFEKSIEALGTSYHFNYSMALDIPPYANCQQRKGSYVPVFDELCDTWANWVNRSIFETFQKFDVGRMQKSPPDNNPRIETVY